MAWINLAAERLSQRTELDEIEFFDDGYEDIEEVAAVLLPAALSGELERFSANAEVAAALVLDGLSALTARRRKITSGRNYSEYLTGAILMHLSGRDLAGELDWLATTKLPEDEHALALQHLVAVALGHASPGTGPARAGHDEALEGWTDAVRTAPTDNLVDLVLCPDHAAWRQLKEYAAPTVFAHMGGPSGDRATGLRMLQWATQPSRADALIYTRETERPPYDADAGAEDAMYAQGFDVVMAEDDRTVCIYNLSMRFLAPWILDDKLDAFWFLRWIDEDWDAATAAVPGALQARLIQARNRRCTYRIAYDPLNATTNEAYTRAASEKYGIAIEMVSFLEC